MTGMTTTRSALITVVAIVATAPVTLAVTPADAHRDEPPILPACVFEDGSGQGTCVVFRGRIDGDPAGDSYVVIRGGQRFDGHRVRGPVMLDVTDDQALRLLGQRD